MQQRIKRVLRVLLFLLILVLLLGAASLLFRPKGNRAEDGMYDSNPNSIIAEPDNTVDVLILGDSEADCAFLPQKIWNDYGISVYICGLGGGDLHHSAYFLNKALKHQNLKMVILEAHHLFSDFSPSDEVLMQLGDIFPVFRYHNRWKSLQLQDFTKPARYDSLEYQKGYHFDWRVAPADTTHYMEPSDGTRMIADSTYECVREIKQQCAERGIALMIMASPSVINWNYQKHNSMVAFAQEMDLPFVDMNLLREEVPVDWELETQDYGDHVNFAGAKKVSAFTGKLLWETGLFQDKRGGPESENWDWVIGQFLTINNLPANALDDE